jgi:streptogramin lyase
MPADLSIGAVLAGHRLEAIVGQGGMGVVYRALHLKLDRTVALKVILPQFAAQPGFRERFEAESRHAAGIDHTNVIPIYHAGEEDGVLFVTMRYVEGSDVRELLRARGALETALAAHIVSGTGAALDAAHARGLVHRDVKPANILVAGAGHEPHVYLTDFGLTKRARSLSGLTGGGHWVGTVDYIAPEQIEAKALDGRADVYALGCVLFEVLTGRVPYAAEGEQEKLLAHLGLPPPRPTEHRPDLPADVDEVVARAMAKAPSDRYATAGELARAAIAAVAGSDAEPPGAATRIRRPSPDAGSGGKRAVGVRPAVAPEDAAATVTSPTRRAARPRRGRRFPIVAGIVLLAIAVGVAGLLLTGREGRPSTSIAVGSAPGEIALGAGSAWVVSRGDRSIYRILAGPAENGSPTVTRFRGLDPRGVAVGGGGVWVTTTDRRLVQIDPAANRFAPDPVRLPGAVAMTAGAGAVWVADGVRSVVRVGGGHTTTIRVGGRPSQVAVGEGAVWVLHAGGARLSRIDPGSNRVAGPPVEVPGGSDRLAAGEGGVWVGSAGRRTLHRIDPRSASRTGALLRLPAAPTDIAAGSGAVWVTSAEKGSVLRVDPRSGRTTSVQLADAPDQLAVGAEGVWVTLPGADRVTRLESSAFTEG